MARHRSIRPLMAIVAVLVLYFLYLISSQGRVVPKAREEKPSTVEESHGTPASDLSSSRVAVLTMNNRESSYDVLSLSNKKSYANRHNYDFRVDFEGPGFWHKLNMIEDAIKLNRYDWVWWIDFDTLVTNSSIKVTDIVQETLQNHTNPETVSMILTPDCFPFNSGSMIFRTSPDMISFLNLVRKCNHDHEGLTEQDCMRDLLGVKNSDSPEEASEEWSKRAVFIPQHKMNAFPEEIPCFDHNSRGWQKGDFVIHFAGSWAHVKEKDPVGYLMDKYRGQIVDH